MKELHFFDRGADRRIDRWRRHAPRFARAWRRRRTGGAQARSDARFYRRFLTSPSHSWAAYRSWFEEPEGRLCGEITPAYCALTEERIAEIRRRLPQLRILFMMRDPIDRAWSAVVKSLAREAGRAPADLSREDWEPKLRSSGLARRSDYLGILERWEGAFGAERVFVGFLEDLEDDPVGFLARLGDFLELKPSSGPRLPEGARNASGRERVPPEVELVLGPQFLEMNRALHERFGSHATRWYERTRRICESRGAASRAGEAVVPEGRAPSAHDGAASAT